MNKNKLITTIVCFILIGFVAIVYMNRQNKKSQTEYITIIQSAESTTVPANDRHSAEQQKHKSTTTRKSDSDAVITETTVEEQLYIDINTASRDELIKLPHIGEAIADSIIAFRENNGGFCNIEEIMLVNGIGEGIFSDIRNYIYVENPIYAEDVTIVSETEPDIPHETEEEPTELTSEEITEQDGPALEDVIPIDLNTADKEILMLIPYISEEAAEKIIKLRDDIGRFSHPYELYYAEVLEPSQIEEICEYVTVEPHESEESTTTNTEE